MSILQVLKKARSKLYRDSTLFLSTAFSDKFLLLTNIAISMGLSGAGDSIEQKLEIKRKVIKKFDSNRNKNMIIAGGPPAVIVHYWYKLLEVKMPGFGLYMAIKKMFLGQSLCSPVCIITIFFTLGYLDRKSTRTIIGEIKDKFFVLFIAEWVVWTPVQIINFLIVPFKFRILFDSTIALGYNVFASYIRFLTKDDNKKKKRKQK